MNNTFQKLILLRGYKTYVVGLAMIILGFYNGDDQMILTGIGFLTMRAGISKINK